jgi:mRNA interferase RelE/StbE
MWALSYEKRAQENFRALDKSQQRRIMGYMAEVCALTEPGSRGKPLRGDLAGHWRYRVGDYRLVCRIEKHQLVIVVVTLGHRSVVYD